MFTEAKLYRLIQVIAASDILTDDEKKSFFDSIMHELVYFKQEEPLDNFVGGNPPERN